MEQQENSIVYKLRHSLAHIMAEAVQRVRPGTKLGFGPPIEDGFYYDFILSRPISDKDFKSIEREMKKIIARGHSFVREELAPEEAYRRMEGMGEPYKVEYAKELGDRKGTRSAQLLHRWFFRGYVRGASCGVRQRYSRGLF